MKEKPISREEMIEIANDQIRRYCSEVGGEYDPMNPSDRHPMGTLKVNRFNYPIGGQTNGIMINTTLVPYGKVLNELIPAIEMVREKFE